MLLGQASAALPLSVEYVLSDLLKVKASLLLVFGLYLKYNFN